MKRQECYSRITFAKMPVQGSGKLLGLRRVDLKNAAVGQQDLVAFDMEMDRIGPKPVAMVRSVDFPSIGPQRDGRNRPVLLLCNSKGIAKPTFDFSGSSLIHRAFRQQAF
jgi:hypothetical protein